jgi:uncharacterized protein YlbG (UPF0298 family)
MTVYQKINKDGNVMSTWDSEEDAYEAACESKYEEVYVGKDELDELEDKAAKAKLFEHIALEVMRALEANGQADFVLLKDRKVREWWTDVKAKEGAARKKREAKEARERAIAEALAKLTAEEKKLLGLTK